MEPDNQFDPLHDWAHELGCTAEELRSAMNESAARSSTSRLASNSSSTSVCRAEVSPRVSRRAGRSMVRLVFLLFSALLAAAAVAQPFAYVTNEKSGTVSVIDTAVDRVVGEIPAG